MKSGLVLFIVLFMVTPLIGQDAPAEPPKEVTPAPTDPTDPPLPRLEDLPLPTAEVLLKEKPVDWIVLHTDHVFVVESLRGNRPGLLGEIEAKLTASLKWPKPKTAAEAREQMQKRAELQKFQLTLANDNADVDYLLDMKHVKQIIFHEDLLLRRVDALLDDRQLSTAYELIARVTANNPQWPGLAERVQRLHFVEAAVLFEKNQPEDALRSLEALAELNPNYDGLLTRLNNVAGLLLDREGEREDYRALRHFWSRITRRYPDCPAALQWQQRLIARTQEMLATARQAPTPEEGALLADRAARIWPATPGLKDAHRELFDRHPSLNIGVLTLPEPETPLFPTRGQQRAQRLTELRLFEPARLEEGGLRYRSSICEEWEPRDLGRELRLSLTARRLPWESRAVVTAYEVQAALRSRLEPDSPLFNPQFAAMVKSLELRSPFEISIKFNQALLRPEALLTVPVSFPANSSALSQDLVMSPMGNGAPQGRFTEWRRGAKDVVYRRSREQTPSSRGMSVVDLKEQQFSTSERALQGLLRGDIDLLPRVELAEAKRLQQDSRFWTLQYALPETHLLQFHPQQRLMQLPTVRRALVAAVPRGDLLRNEVLKDAEAGWGRLTTAPYAIASTFYNRVQTQPKFDLLVAVSLVTTAKRELQQETLSVRIACPSDPDLLRNCESIRQAWRRAGIESELVSSPDEKNWDVAYRAVQMADPLIELWPFVAGTNDRSVEQLQPLSDRIRSTLLEAEQAGDWQTAVRLVQRLQSDMLSEARWLPLWELDQFWVARRRVVGVPQRPLHPYDGVERWIVQAWYPQETP